MGTKLRTSIVHKRFGAQVRKLRKQLDKTQEDIAHDIGISAVYLGHVERGERNITLDKISKLAKALHVMIKELFP